MVHAARLAGSKDRDVEAELREPCVLPFERCVEAEAVAVEPLGVARVDDEPALAGRDTPASFRSSGASGTTAPELIAMERSLPVAERPRRPEWMRVRAPSPDSRYYEVKSLPPRTAPGDDLRGGALPEHRRVLGSRHGDVPDPRRTCTRACRYCYVDSGKPDGPPDPLEPFRLAHAAAQMQLSHVVVTSVDRDDLADRGAAHFAATIRALRAKLPGATVELLTPDFLGVEEEALATVLAARPEVFNHNIETVRRLHARMRGAKASYDKALWLLERAKEVADYPG